jgi:TatD DNase family protein
MFVDSHCHLDRLKLDQCGGSLEAALASARADGVEHMLCVCISPENRQTVLDIACSDPYLYASAGVHPSDVQREVVSVSTLQQWCDHPKVVALGETGLDYHYAAESKDQQRQSFINHLVAGKNLALPVIVHSREARAETLELIRDHGCRKAAGVLHCFTESWEMAQAALDMNYYISISGIVTFRNADELRDVAKKIPLDRLLIETDSPYLAPIPYRGKSNQPRYVRAVGEFLADLRGIPVEALAEQTTANFFRLFSRAA